jgi:transcriptional/translational regulatory protein YebC/TACO1
LVLAKRFAGHNKWSKIFRLKADLDQQKGKRFSKLSQEIITAIRTRGGVTDINLNSSLAMAIERAKSYQMPKATIEAAIKRASGQDSSASMQENILYEGYGPFGIALLIDVLTDNRNRTATHLRTILSKYG